MTLSTGMTPQLLALWGARFRELPLYCANESSVGCEDIDAWRDWTHRETTPGQRALEGYLRAKCNAKSTVFHVGIGNSELATEFSPLVSMVVGITIQQNEVAHALRRNTPHYFPMLMNKYSLAFSHAFPGQFDFVLDNNPAAFSCCYFHFCRMMNTYRALLREGGEIVTCRRGLEWILINANQRWRFDFADWHHVAEALQLSATDVDGEIYTMQRTTR